MKNKFAATHPPVAEVVRAFYIFVFLCTLMIIGCGSLKTTKIIPMFDPESAIFQQTNSIAYEKNGIIAIVIPLNDVKEVDAFGLIIANKTNHLISFRENDCWLLDQSGKGIKTIAKSQRSFYLGKNFKPKLPQGFSAEVFKWNRGIRLSQSGFAVMQSEIDETTIMPGRKKQLFLYFKKQSTQSSKIRLIIPKVHNDFTGKDITFVFKFQIEKS